MIIKKLNLILLLSSFSILCSAQQGSIKDRKDLQVLLEERREKFDSYTSSLEKRSGIFGNKTKKDILASNEVLINIVQTDNHIISTLYRVIDLKNFEKSNRNYDVVMQGQNYENLLHATDTLSKQIDILKISNKTWKGKAIKFQVLFYITFALIILMLINKWRKK
jgi:hypothetical protein